MKKIIEQLGCECGLIIDLTSIKNSITLNWESWRCQNCLSKLRVVGELWELGKLKNSEKDV